MQQRRITGELARVLQLTVVRPRWTMAHMLSLQGTGYYLQRRTTIVLSRQRLMPKPFLRRIERARRGHEEIYRTPGTVRQICKFKQHFCFKLLTLAGLSDLAKVVMHRCMQLLTFLHLFDGTHLGFQIGVSCMRIMLPCFRRAEPKAVHCCAQQNSRLQSAT